MSSKTLHEKLSEVQVSLVAKKSQWNDFSKFSYRTTEDILAGLKPLIKKLGLTVKTDVAIEAVLDRVYIAVTASVSDGMESISVKAYAREPQTKKGMDEAQITGAATSYARKYALAGLFAIDDEESIDNQDNQPITEQQKGQLKAAIRQLSRDGQMVIRQSLDSQNLELDSIQDQYFQGWLELVNNELEQEMQQQSETQKEPEVKL